MVCQSCKDKNHELCQGTTWCDCQHRTPEQIMDSIDAFLANPGSGVRRERPVRKEEPTWHEVKSAEELTALLQEMEQDDGPPLQ